MEDFRTDTWYKHPRSHQICDHPTGDTCIQSESISWPSPSSVLAISFCSSGPLKCTKAVVVVMKIIPILTSSRLVIQQAVFCLDNYKVVASSFVWASAYSKHLLKKIL